MSSPVVLLHGFAGSFERTWRQPGFADLLGDTGRTVVGIDLLGHGNADKPHDPAAYADLEGHARTALDEAVPDGVVDAVGFSLGARTLLGLAADTPDRFGRLVIAGVGDRLFQDGSGEPIARALEAPPDPDDAVGHHMRVLADVPGNDLAALAACMRRTPRPVTPSLLAQIACPVLVVVGDRDQLAGAPEPLAEALPDARLLVLARTDHSATPESFAFIDAAIGFLG
jgi:pimeloyl-ACP methyl ester carboxylesterase